MGKLVRDRIPEIIRERGGTSTTRTLPADAYRAQLVTKLVEEAQELRDASMDSVLDEAADVYEVLLTIASVDGLTMERVIERAATKRVERGGFACRIFLESYT